MKTILFLLACLMAPAVVWAQTPPAAYLGPAEVTHFQTGAVDVGIANCAPDPTMGLDGHPGTGADCYVKWSQVIGLFWDTHGFPVPNPGDNACGFMWAQMSGGYFAPYIYTEARGGEYVVNPGFIETMAGAGTFLLWSLPDNSWFEPYLRGIVRAYRVFQSNQAISCSEHPELDGLWTNPTVTNSAGQPMPVNQFGNYDCTATQPCFVRVDGGRPMSGIIMDVGSWSLPREIAGVDAAGNRGAVTFRSQNSHFSYYVPGDLTPALGAVVAWQLTGLGLSAPDVSGNGSIIHVTQPYCRDGSLVWP